MSNLTQTEADALIALAKRRVDATEHKYPVAGMRITIPLASTDGRESFLMDLRRSRLNLAKGTYQNRVRQVVVLVRLDFGGSPHRNPDGQKVGTPHLHVYREGYGDKWAQSLPSGQFKGTDDPWRLLEDFMQFCNVIEPPVILRGLFT